MRVFAWVGSLGAVLLVLTSAAAQPVDRGDEKTAIPGTSETSPEKSGTQPSGGSAATADSELTDEAKGLPDASRVSVVNFEFRGPNGEPDASAALKALKRGQALAKKMDHSAAVGEFEQAYALGGKGDALTEATKSYEALSDWPKAYGLAAQQLRDHKPTAAKQLQALENKINELAAKTAELRVEVSEADAHVEVDGIVWLDRTAAGNTSVVGRVSSGPHAVKVSKDGFDAFAESTTLEPGGTAALTASLKPSEKPEPPPPPAVPLPPGGLTQADVKDFCRVSIANTEARFQRQKLVIFDLAGEEVTNGPEQEVNAKGQVIAQHRVFQAAGIHGHLRTVYFSAFPSPRFYTVKAKTASPASLRSRAVVPAPEMIRAAGNDAFAAYSLACSDWAAMPRVVGKDATWRKVEREVFEHRGGHATSRKYMVWDLSVTWDLEVGVYKREGDQWRLVATVEGSNGGLLGIAGGLTQALEGIQEAENVMSAAQLRGPGRKGLPLVSDRPDPSCKVPFVSTAATTIEAMQQCEESAAHPGTALANAAGNTAQALGTPPQPGAAGDPQKAQDGVGTIGRIEDAALADVKPCRDAVEGIAAGYKELLTLAQPGAPQLDGLFACVGVGASFDLPPEAVAPGTGQLRTGFCRNLSQEQRSGVAFGEAAMFNVATCVARVRMDLATQDVQKTAHRLPGWKLYAPLDQRPGSAQPPYGLALGDYEGVKRGDTYIAVTVMPDGSTVPMGPFGHIVGPVGPGGIEGSLGGDKLSPFRFRKGEAPYGTRMEELSQIGIALGLRGQGSLYTSAGDLDPGIGKGASLEGGYNASEYVPFADEIWSRIYISGEVGDNKTFLLNVDAVPEATFYLVDALGAYTGTGISFAAASVKANTGADPNGEDTEEAVWGIGIGAVVVAGLDYALSPEWNIRAGMQYRQGITKVELTDKAKTVTVDAGLLSAARANLGAVYTF